MKQITYKNLKGIDGKPLVLEVPDDFDCYADSAAYATLVGRINGKRFRRAFRNAKSRNIKSNA